MFQKCNQKAIIFVLKKTHHFLECVWLVLILVISARAIKAFCAFWDEEAYGDFSFTALSQNCHPWTDRPAVWDLFYFPVCVHTICFTACFQITLCIAVLFVLDEFVANFSVLTNLLIQRSFRLVYLWNHFLYQSCVVELKYALSHLCSFFMN